MGQNKDYYDILGVSRNASRDEIKSAFREKARMYHPDANSGSGDDTRFNEINNAYSTLWDPAKREKYDLQFNAKAKIEGGPRWGGVRQNDFNMFFGGHLMSMDSFFTGGSSIRDKVLFRASDLGLINAMYNSYLRNESDGYWRVESSPEDKVLLPNTIKSIYSFEIKDGAQAIYRTVEDWRKSSNRPESVVKINQDGTREEKDITTRFNVAFLGKDVRVEGVTLPPISMYNYYITVDSLAWKMAKLKLEGLENIDISEECRIINNDGMAMHNSGDKRIHTWDLKGFPGDVEGYGCLVYKEGGNRPGSERR